MALKLEAKLPLKGAF